MTIESTNMKKDPFPRLQAIAVLLDPGERLRLVLLVCMMIVGVGLETVGIGLVIPTITLFTQQDIASKYPMLKPALAWLGNPDRPTLVIYGLGLLFSVYMVKTVFLSLFVWVQNRFVFGIEERLSLKLFTMYMQRPYLFHLRNNSSRLIRNVSGEISLFANSVLTPVMQMTAELLIMITLCGILFHTEPYGTVIVMLVFGLVGWTFNRSIRRRIGAWGTSRQYHDAMRLQHLQQGLDGVKDVRLLGRERYFLNLFAMHNREGIRVGRLNATLGQLPRLWLELLTVGGLFGLVFSMMSHGGDLSGVLPKLGLFSVATFRLIPSVNRILFSSQVLKYCAPVTFLLAEEFSMPTGKPGDTVQRNGWLRETLELRNIRFSYTDSHTPAIADLSLRIACGESIGIVGPSGAGKSTLVDILLGLVEPDCGEVLVDGQDIHGNVRWWQDQIGYVPQSIYLTDDTIRRNIAFGIPDADIDDGAVDRALVAASLDTFIGQLPDGLDTVIGERGARLSGGQRQRIGIARALYHDPSVLVLDEATSALDLETENEVVKAVKALKGKKTIIIVAHRLSTIEHCDRVYTIAQGGVAGGETRQGETSAADREIAIAVA
jgi:ATP-binding cassette, subfamily B, bacterial PglK